MDPKIDQDKYHDLMDKLGTIPDDEWNKERDALREEFGIEDNTFDDDDDDE